MSRRIEIDSDHWYTPISILGRTKQVFPRRWYDPTTSSFVVSATPKHLRPVMYCAGDFLQRTALPLDDTPVFMNPPYSKAVGTAGAFTDHLIAIRDRQPCIILVNASTDTKWWQRLAAASDAICFVQGRIKFDRLDAQRNRIAGGSPRYANTIHLIDPEGSYVQAFRLAFRDAGVIR